MRHRTLALLPILLLVIASFATGGVRGDGEGRRPVVTGDVDAVWSPDDGELDRTSLNPRGDLFGDGRPHIEQAPDGSWWAVWSFADRKDRDIAVSRFDGSSWSPFEMIVSGNGRADLDPRIAFLGSGQPVVVWWQKGIRGDRDPRVVSSHMTAAGWSSVQVLSDAPAWRPGILVSGEMLTVAWDTAEGIRLTRFRMATLPNGMPADPSPFPGRSDDDDDDPDQTDDDDRPIRPAD